MVDDSGVIQVANPVAEQIFGYSNEEISGMPMEGLLPQRYRGGHISFRRDFANDPHPRRMGFGRDLTALRRDGTEFPVEISLSYTKLQGSLLVMAFISDISQRKKAEDDLKRSEEQLIVYAGELEKKVQVRTEALNHTIGKLEEEVNERRKVEDEVRKSLEKEKELNELKSKFVTIASHEFRTPLSTVLSSASLVQQYLDRRELEKIPKHVQRIKSSVNHLTGILNDFLSLGKLEEGNIALILEEIHLLDFLKEVEEEIRATLKTDQFLEIHCDVCTDRVISDARVLRHIFFNLISNASKYSDPGKIIHVHCSEHEKGISISVQDEGIGIPREDLKHMFERFFRASNAGNVQGTGLGLNIVKRYVDLLQGTIEFTSEYGKGSTFTVSIPWQQSQ